MAHYPRWVGSNVDSSAMLSAYLDWTHRATEQELQATVPHLWLVEHRAPGLAQPLPLRVGGITIPSRPCTTPACNRCTQLWGGYQFRWIDARWLDKYETMRRPGSWSSAPRLLPREEDTQGAPSSAAQPAASSKEKPTEEQTTPSASAEKAC